MISVEMRSRTRSRERITHGAFIAAMRIALPATLTALSAIVAAQSATEQQCIDAVQGKVAWNRAGDTTWQEGNIRDLCQGTTDAAATIACFQSEIGKHDDWSRAIATCKGASANAQAPSASTAPAAQAAVSPEQQCVDAVQGKVAWNRAGDTTWQPGNLRNLCQGTTNASATIACFEGEIRAHGDWSRAIDACKAATAIAPAQTAQQTTNPAPPPGADQLTGPAALVARDTPAFSKEEFIAKLGANPRSSLAGVAGANNGSTATGTSTGATAAAGGNNTGLNESALPFKDFTNYPAFYVIPPEKRPRVMNQGQCGSCVAWTTSTALVSVLLNQHKYNLFTALNMVDAQQFFVSAGRNCKSGASNYGWWNDAAVSRLATTGAKLAIVEPTSNGGALGSSLATDMSWWIKAGKSGSITNKDAMRKFIATQGALAAEMTLAFDFPYYKSGIYDHDTLVKKIVDPVKNNALTKSAGEALEKSLNGYAGGHAMTVIGYFKGGTINLKDYMRPLLPAGADLSIYNVEVPFMPAFWIVQNSWGTGSFGTNGLIYIAADQHWTVYDKPGGFCYQLGTSCPADPIDDVMYYMLDPVVTDNGKEIL